MQTLGAEVNATQLGLLKAQEAEKKQRTEGAMDGRMNE